MDLVIASIGLAVAYLGLAALGVALLADGPVGIAAFVLLTIGVVVVVLVTVRRLASRHGTRAYAAGAFLSGTATALYVSVATLLQRVGVDLQVRVTWASALTLVVASALTTPLIVGIPIRQPGSRPLGSRPVGSQPRDT